VSVCGCIGSQYLRCVSGYECATAIGLVTKPMNIERIYARSLRPADRSVAPKHPPPHPSIVVVTGRFGLFLLRKHFITEFFFKNINPAM